MKTYIASYQDKKEKCWDLVFEAENHKEARKDARKRQKEYGKLYSVRRYYLNNLPF